MTHRKFSAFHFVNYFPKSQLHRIVSRQFHRRASFAVKFIYCFVLRHYSKEPESLVFNFFSDNRKIRMP